MSKKKRRTNFILYTRQIEAGQKIVDVARPGKVHRQAGHIVRQARNTAKQDTCIEKA